jgi:hypothetical protein
LLLSIPEANVDRDLLNNHIIVESLDLVAIAHEDTEVDFFKSKIGSVYRELKEEPKVLAELRIEERKYDKVSSEIESQDGDLEVSDDNDENLLSVDSHILRKLTDQSNSLVEKLETAILRL